MHESGWQSQIDRFVSLRQLCAVLYRLAIKLIELFYGKKLDYKNQRLTSTDVTKMATAGCLSTTV